VADLVARRRRGELPERWNARLTSIASRAFCVGDRPAPAFASQDNSSHVSASSPAKQRPSKPNFAFSSSTTAPIIGDTDHRAEKRRNINQKEKEVAELQPA
jgi:hypothetical protein